MGRCHPTLNEGVDKISGAKSRLKKDKAGTVKDKEKEKKRHRPGQNGERCVRICVCCVDITFVFNSLIHIFRSVAPHFGRLEELRTLCKMIRSIPSELKSVVRDGCDRCPAFTMLIQKMVNVPGGCVIVRQAE